MVSARVVASIVIALTLAALGLTRLAAGQAEPGLVVPFTSEASDQKKGSVLFYNLYTSSATNPSQQDTRFSLTNTSTTSAAFMRLFFVDGSTGSVASSFICLTANQTAAFQASDLRPGVTGFLIAIAVDGVVGCPVSFNHLTGQAQVSFATGHRGALNAVAFAAIAAVPSVCDANSVTVQLSFEGVFYNRAPRALHVPHVPSRADGTDTLLVLSRLGGNLGAAGASIIGGVTGFLYDDAETVFGFGFNAGVPQFRASLSNTFPATAPPFETVIPAGRTGWMRLFAANDVGLIGSVLYLRAPGAGPIGFPFPAKPAPVARDVPGAANLFISTLSAINTVTIPVTAPSC